MSKEAAENAVNTVVGKTERKMSYVVVKFEKNGNKYTYVADGDAVTLGAEGFTHAVVNSPYNGLTVVEVTSITDIDLSTYTGKYKPVVTLFNKNAHDEIIAREERARVLTERLKKKIEERAFIDRAHELLRDDDEASAMLAELKSLR